MRKVPGWLWVGAVLSAVLQLLPFPLAGPVPLWRRMFCWFCLVPLMLAVTARGRDGKLLGWRSAAWVGYACGVTWYAGNCYWIYQTMYLYGGLPKPVALFILLLFSLYLGLYLALFGGLTAWIAGRYSRETAIALSPVIWVAVELARARITGFPWDLLGYAQVDNLLLAKLAPLGGVMLLSFVIVTGNSLFALAWSAPVMRKRLVFGVAALLFTAGVQAGVLYGPAADATSASAVLLQENLAVGSAGREVERLSAAEKYRQFVSLSKNPDSSDGSHAVSSEDGSRHDLIVWPEAPADFATSDPVFLAQAGGLAKATATPLIAGSVGVDFDKSAEGGYREYGSAAVFGSDGSYLGRYDKIHRVPWGEYVPYKALFFFAGHLIDGVGNMSAGTQHSLFSLNGHTAGIFICYESIFGNEVRQFVLGGADVLVNISDDGWYGDTGAPWQHLDMERMRAIENHRWILRDTNTGVTTSIDPHGRGVFSTPRHVREAFVFPFGYVTGTTFYTRHGDWFAWICALITMVTVGFGWLRGLGRKREVN